MAKTIRFNYDNKDYTLEYTRATVQKAEERGLDISGIVSKPAVTISRLFNGAFIKNHGIMNTDKTDEILEALDNKSMMIDRLVEMYNDAFDTIASSEGNVRWEE